MKEEDPTMAASTPEAPKESEVIGYGFNIARTSQNCLKQSISLILQADTLLCAVNGEVKMGSIKSC